MGEQLFDPSTAGGEKKMKIEEWFDPFNRVHLEAWKHLNDVGAWPVGFIPEGMAFTGLWQVTLATRLANLYVAEKLGGTSDISSGYRRRCKMKAYPKPGDLVVLLEDYPYGSGVPAIDLGSTKEGRDAGHGAGICRELGSGLEGSFKENR